MWLVISHFCITECCVTGLFHTVLMIDGHCVPWKIIALAARNLYHLLVWGIFKFIRD